MNKSKELTAEEIRTFIETKGKQAFYLHGSWRRKRKEILKAQHYECQECKKKGKAVTATIVHHIKHLKQFPELAYEDSNLEAVCESCHNVLHPEKLKKFHKNQWNDEKW